MHNIDKLHTDLKQIIFKYRLEVKLLHHETSTKEKIIKNPPNLKIVTPT